MNGSGFKPHGEWLREKTLIGGHDGERVEYRWYRSADLGKWEGVEVWVDGGPEAPSREMLELLEQVVSRYPEHLAGALRYLREFFPHQPEEDYELMYLSIGQFRSYEGRPVTGFTLEFVYGDYPDAFQYKVKFKADGWPIGFEGGPL